MKKQKFLNKAAKTIEKKLDKNLKEIEPFDEVYCDTSEHFMSITVFAMDKSFTGHAQRTKIGEIKLDTAYEAREELDCSVKEIILPWANKLVEECKEFIKKYQKNYENNAKKDALSKTAGEWKKTVESDPTLTDIEDPEPDLEEALDQLKRDDPLKDVLPDADETLPFEEEKE